MTEAPKGFNDPDKLTVPGDQSPSVMAGRLLKKTGPVETTIRDYCNSHGLSQDDPEYVLLGLSGAMVAAMGRRSQRKHPDADPKEMIKHEWKSAERAHNFMAEIIEGVVDFDENLTKRVGNIEPSWREVKPKVVEKLGELGITNLDTIELRDIARRGILVEKYRNLEESTDRMILMLYIACKKYGVTGERVRGLTDTILNTHYPEIPPYEPDKVSKNTPLAYEGKTLESWRELLKELD
ncbi:hypothetical protein A2Z67_01515 [Candidatus Woesebacteria bacterium RBG_13_36_22]|uniref:Uncharacterized protein n=1 Tax=Candidatus Woesebacteria bacterium RBG_13_36_22 TaxID=1802478 RepID=A0A1F7X0G5_9BACT|nr:MAG: hypothetical protein A2Z67_01515 [Candidatus Woesebacteria bacterium RBG_13_36_22]